MAKQQPSFFICFVNAAELWYFNELNSTSTIGTKTILNPWKLTRELCSNWRSNSFMELNWFLKNILNWKSLTRAMRTGEAMHWNLVRKKSRHSALNYATIEEFSNQINYKMYLNFMCSFYLHIHKLITKH